MKNGVIIVLFFGFTVVLGDESQYTTKYDNIDLDEIIKSDRLLKNYVNCLLGKGKCTPDGLELKRKLNKTQIIRRLYLLALEHLNSSRWFLLFS